MPCGHRGSSLPRSQRLAGREVSLPRGLRGVVLQHVLKNAACGNESIPPAFNFGQDLAEVGDLREDVLELVLGELPVSVRLLGVLLTRQQGLAFSPAKLPRLLSKSSPESADLLSCAAMTAPDTAIRQSWNASLCSRCLIRFCRRRRDRARSRRWRWMCAAWPIHVMNALILTTSSPAPPGGDSAEAPAGVRPSAAAVPRAGGGSGFASLHCTVEGACCSVKCVPAGVEKVWKMVAPAPPEVPAAGAAAAIAPMVSGVPLPECSASIRESRRETILVRWLVLSCSPPPPDGGWGESRPPALGGLLDRAQA